MKAAPSQPIFEEQGKYEMHLTQKGLKLSSGRQTIFREIMDTHGHFTAEDLVKKCKSKKRKVSRATIYRSFKELLEAGVIRKTAFGEKHEHYEHVYDEKLHHHARCIRCYAVIEFPCLPCNTIYTRSLQNQGFQVLGHEMHFYGICRVCQAKEGKL